MKNEKHATHLNFLTLFCMSFKIKLRLDKPSRNYRELETLLKRWLLQENILFFLIGLLIKLFLILSVATATVQIAFSIMKIIIKSSLCNRIWNKQLNNCLVTYIERDLFANVSNEAIMHQFQNIKNIYTLIKFYDVIILFYYWSFNIYCNWNYDFVITSIKNSLSFKFIWDKFKNTHFFL